MLPRPPRLLQRRLVLKIRCVLLLNERVCLTGRVACEARPRVPLPPLTGPLSFLPPRRVLLLIHVEFGCPFLFASSDLFCGSPSPRS